MYDNIELMRTAQSMARHASQRQSLVARNVANADTPGHRSRDLASFAETYRAAGPASALRVTRPAHMTSTDAQGGFESIDAGGEPAPNGNTVSLETEMIRTAELRNQHDMAMAVFAKARDILRTSLGRGR